MTKLVKYKILIIDDDKDILELLGYNLKRLGYEVMMETNSQSAVQVAKAFKPDLIILDIMMPYVNGIEVCQRLRSLEDFRRTYIFFLTAVSDQKLQTRALNMGGDDYIEKKTGLRALSYKIGAVLRRQLTIRKSIKQIAIGDFVINRETSTARYKGKDVQLPRNEFELLYFFAQNPHKVINQDSLLHNIWGSDIYLLAKSVDTYVDRICNKIGGGLIARVDDQRYRFEVN